MPQNVVKRTIAYTFDELDEKAKQNVINGFNIDDSGFFIDNANEHAAYLLEKAGITPEIKSFEWNLEGDSFFVFDGVIECDEALAAEAAAMVMPDRLAKVFCAWLHYEIAQVTCDTGKRSYRYRPHQETNVQIDFMLSSHEKAFSLYVKEMEEYIKNKIYSLCEDIRIALTKMYEYENSEENIREICEVNEYIFDKNGKMLYGWEVE